MKSNEPKVREARRENGALRYRGKKSTGEKGGDEESLLKLKLTVQHRGNLKATVKNR